MIMASESESTDLRHSLGNFEEALRESRSLVIKMGSLAQQNLTNAMNGLLQRDEDLCNDAIAEDEEVNAIERSIDQGGMEILMRFNPVATDLRSVLAAMKIANNIERISDQAENIARRARKILKKKEVEDIRLIEPIYDAATAMLQDAAKAYAESDTELALTLFERDKHLNKLHRKAIKHYTQAMEADTENIKTYLHLIFIVRCLERIGDHSVNICEEAVYITHGTSIKHVGPSALES